MRLCVSEIRGSGIWRDVAKADLFVLALGICLAAISSPGFAATLVTPKIVPAGWIADYDYDSDVFVYLAKQYQQARQSDLTLYVYFYDDSESHCRAVRKTLRVDYVQDAFAGTQIVMLNMDRLQRLYDEKYSISIESLE